MPWGCFLTFNIWLYLSLLTRLRRRPLQQKGRNLGSFFLSVHLYQKQSSLTRGRWLYGYKGANALAMTAHTEVLPILCKDTVILLKCKNIAFIFYLIHNIVMWSNCSAIINFSHRFHRFGFGFPFRPPIFNSQIFLFWGNAADYGGCSFAQDCTVFH